MLDAIDKPQPSQVETQHFNIDRTTDYLAAQEKRLATLGSRDEKTTNIFQNYHLPSQESVRRSAEGKEVKVVRSLVDPEEYVIALDKTKGGNQLLKVVREDQRGFAESWKKYGFEGEPPLYSSLEIIVGNPAIPNTCYRYKLQDAQANNVPEISLVVGQNVEHEKEKGAFVPFGADSGATAEPEEKKGDSTPDTTPPSSMTVINPNDFSESQRDLINKRDLPPSIGFGRRTGDFIAHQRAPQDMTRFSEDVTTLKVNTQTGNVWVVVVSADAVEKQRNQDK